MLVLTRKLMERLYIGGDICVTVVRLEGSQVRLGIEAPRHVPVVRAELKRYERPPAAAAELEGAAATAAAAGELGEERMAVAPGLGGRPARVRSRAVRE